MPCPLTAGKALLHIIFLAIRHEHVVALVAYVIVLANDSRSSVKKKTVAT